MLPGEDKRIYAPKDILYHCLAALGFVLAAVLAPAYGLLALGAACFCVREVDQTKDANWKPWSWSYQKQAETYAPLAILGIAAMFV